MKTRWTVFLWSARLLWCAAIMCVPARMYAQCPGITSVTYNGVNTVEGKPFQAKAIMTITTYADNGAKQVEVTNSNLFRDGQGRVRVERFYDGSNNPPENVPTDILIYDNCGTSVSLLPARHTAKTQKLILPADARSRPYHCQEIDLENPPNSGEAGKFEYLGHKMIDGVEIRGERTVYYSSVAARVSGAAPVRMNEDWCAMELDTPMGNSTRSERPKRETMITFSDVQQVNSDAELFEIPQGYKIINAEQSATDANAKTGEAPPKTQ